MKRFLSSILFILCGAAMTTVIAQRIGIETNEKHNINTSERRVKGSPIATMEVAGVKVTYPQIAVNPIPGFTTAGGNIKTELAHGEIRNGLEGVLRHIGKLESAKPMRVLDVNHKSQTMKAGAYELGFEYQPNQKMWALQLSRSGSETVNIPLFLKEGAPIIESLTISLAVMPGKTIEIEGQPIRYEAGGFRLNIRWGDLDGTTTNVSFAEDAG
jgi:hypothetical protein